MSEDWDYDASDAENGTAGNRGAAGGQPKNEVGSTGTTGHRPAHAANPSAYASGRSAYGGAAADDSAAASSNTSRHSAYGGAAADDSAAAPSNASRRSDSGEAPTNWDYSSSGSGGSGRHMKDGGGNGGGRKRNRGVVIAIVAVLVVAVVGIVAAVVELTSCDHEWAEATCTEPATCTKCGETEGEALGHDWQEATCTEPETCSRCGETEGEALGHTWEDATCTEPETCSVCGETQGDPLGHTVEEWTVTLEPTDSVEGEQTGTCTVCGEEVTEAIATTDEQTEDATVYNEGQYVVGEDLPAGEYKLYADSSEFEASVVVFADSSSTSAANQLMIASFDDCYYITVDDGQYVDVLEAVIVPVDEAEPTSDAAGSGMYKVGYDIEPGEYRFTARTDADYAYVYVLSSSDVDDSNSSVYGEWLDEGESCTCTLSEGQYLDVLEVDIEPVS